MKPFTLDRHDSEAPRLRELLAEELLAIGGGRPCENPTQHYTCGWNGSCADDGIICE